MKIVKGSPIWEDSIIVIRNVGVTEKDLDTLCQMGQVNEYGEYYDECTQNYRSIPRKYSGLF